MAGVYKLEITETEADLKQRLRSQKTASDKERIQLLYLLKTGQAKTVQAAATLLARHRITLSQPILVVQDAGRTTLINSGDASTAGFAVLPFLQKAGVNEINWAIAADPPSRRPSGWGKIAERLPIKRLHSVEERDTGNHAASQRHSLFWWCRMPDAPRSLTAATLLALRCCRFYKRQG